MINVTTIKESIDCRELIQRDLGQPHTRSGKAWAWKCPFHGEQKGYSLTAWQNGWRCWGACSLSGDAIGWMQHYYNLSFEDACVALGGQDEPNTRRRFQPPARRAPEIAKPPDSNWQIAAIAAVEKATQHLWSSDGQCALSYLGLRRKLYLHTIRKARLGYNPDWYETMFIKEDGKPAYLPPGIVIPWFIGGHLWAVKVRCRVGELAEVLGVEPDHARDYECPKYINLAGGNQAGALYWADELRKGQTALITEGEFDCLIAWQETDALCPVTIGSASNGLNPRWYSALAQCPVILTCYDNDSAGSKAADRIGALGERIRLIQPPEGKDINEYHLKYPLRGVKEWLEGTNS